MKQLQIRVGLDPELLRDRVPEVAEHGERFGLAAIAVKRDHQPAAEALTPGIRCRQCTQLSGRVGVSAQLQAGVDSHFADE
ncbi:hypothetical protein GCM10009838_17820 [Catenulispora subtropica]|uniref:Uncharacterized protein n=1 Tax=Catenulispora subtropica TaxID=450798 RepID=A0ABN2R118_9ACTN